MIAFTGTWVTNHFVPLISTTHEHILDIDNIEEFPPLNSTKVNDSCSACPTIFDDTPILRNTEASETEYQASESEEAISPQIHFAADAEPEIQTPQSLDKHFDLSLPPRCTSDSPLHDDLLAFETESSGASEPENLEESCLKNIPMETFWILINSLIYFLQETTKF